MKGMTLDALAKRIAVRLKLKAGAVRTVLASGKSDLPPAVVSQIIEIARTMIHEELMRLDAKHHPEK